MNAWTHIRKNVFGMTQAEFADRVGVHQSTVCRWEKGALKPSQAEMEKVRALARERGIRWKNDWFFEAPEAA